MTRSDRLYLFIIAMVIVTGNVAHESLLKWLGFIAVTAIALMEIYKRK